MIDIIGWTLVHATWQGGLIAVALATVLWLARGASASVRYALTLVALALTVIAPIATTLAHLPAPERATITDAMATTPTRTTPGHTVTEVAPAVHSNVPRAPSAAERVTQGIAASLPWVVALWLLGIAVLSTRVVAGIANIRRLGRQGVSAADARIRAVANRLAVQLGIPDAIRVLESTQVDVPMVVGWLTPVVLVPIGLVAGLAPAQLEMLLAHELAHIRRRDTLVTLAQTLVETLLFFHPAIWWISARVRDEREHCCDDLAIAITAGDRRAFGAMLLSLEESRGATALATAATDGSLLRRVRRIVLGVPTRVELGTSWLAGVATALTVLIVISASSAPVADAVLARALDRPPSPLLPPSVVQPNSRSTAMPRSSLLAGAAALTIAATRITAVTAHAAPNFSGRWVPIDTASTARTTSAKRTDSLANAFVLEEGDKTLTLRPGDDAEITITGKIEGTDRTTLKVAGPVALNIHGFEVSFDSTFGTRFQGQWGSASFNVSLGATPSRTLALARWTLSLDRDGHLVVQTDMPAGDGKPATQSVTRFRRISPDTANE